MEQGSKSIVVTWSTRNNKRTRRTPDFVSTIINPSKRQRVCKDNVSYWRSCPGTLHALSGVIIIKNEPNSQPRKTKTQLVTEAQKPKDVSKQATGRVSNEKLQLDEISPVALPTGTNLASLQPKPEEGEKEIEGEREEGQKKVACLRASSNIPVSLLKLSSESVQIHEGSNIRSRAKYIPLRLSPKERDLLAILDGALEISEYTDKVDVINRFSKSAIIKREIKSFLNSIEGLYVSQNYTLASKLTLNSSTDERLHFFQSVFEVGRRYKAMNPDKMRSNYGKMMFILQDAPGMINYDIACRPISTVYEFLESTGTISLLDDPNIPAATAAVKSSITSEVAESNLRREEAKEKIRLKYSPKLSLAEVDRVLDSLSDSNNHLLSYRQPIDMMIEYLTKHFHPTQAHAPFSLAIRQGLGGSKLNHSHATQYKFVHQTLLLWREIQHEIFKLWCCADADLLSLKHTYRLMNTGQGLNRVQNAPAVSAAMRSILSRVQSKVGQWVGLSVVHLGDRDVPNALVFIDKYNQVPRILSPIVNVIEKLSEMDTDSGTLYKLKEVWTKPTKASFVTSSNMALTEVVMMVVRVLTDALLVLGIGALR